MNAQILDTIDSLVSETLGRGETVRVRVTTQSMSPLIRPGEVIVVEQANVNSFTRGDLVLWREGEIWITHRLVGRETNGEWVTKGDRAPICDKIQMRRWVGRVRAFEINDKQYPLVNSRTWSQWIARLSFAEGTATQTGARWRARIYRRLVRASALGLRLWLSQFG